VILWLVCNTATSPTGTFAEPGEGTSHHPYLLRGYWLVERHMMSAFKGALHLFLFVFCFFASQQQGVAWRTLEATARTMSPRGGGGGARRRRLLTMDDEVPRPGIRREITTREDSYFAKHFTKISNSGHNLTPLLEDEVEENMKRLPPMQVSACLRGEVNDLSTLHAQETRQGLYVCALGGLPLFSSGCKLVSPPDEESWPCFSEPCDPEHIAVIDEGRELRCVRSGSILGERILDPSSPTHQRWRINGACLEFFELGVPLPPQSQHENYWGSEGQYRAWDLIA
jgi:peptide methionine sulfoxide reductase MsrB